MIGVFDSGSGGLTVISALRARSPRADIIYFGDIKNVPYGTKKPQELSELIGAGMRKLQDMGARELICACNTASASVLQGLVEHDRVLEMTRPTARAMRRFAGQRVLLLATPATVESGMYEQALNAIVQLEQIAVPRLASAIECDASPEEIARLVRMVLPKDRSFDKLLLGCTHYPLARDTIESVVREVMGNMEIIDPAFAVAGAASERFETRGRGQLTFAISQDSDAFRRRVTTLFPHERYSIDVV